MSNQAPAYQMYAGDWLKSRAVRFMDDYQRGWYIQLLNEAWDGKPQCMLPKDDKGLQMLAGISELSRAQPDFNDRWAAVKLMFTEDGEYVYNDRQMSELALQAHRRESAVKGGNASAKKRAEKLKELQALKRQHLAQGNGRSTVVQPEGNDLPTLQSSPSPSPPTSSSNNISEDAKRLSVFLLDEISKAENRKLVSKPMSGHKPLQILMDSGVTASEIEATIVWLATENRKREYPFSVQSGKTLREKWDKIQPARKPNRPQQSAHAKASGNIPFVGARP